MTNPTQTQTENLDFLNNTTTTQPVARKRPIRRNGILGSASASITNGLDTVTATTESVARTMQLANLQLKGAHVEMELEIYANIMDYGYTLDQAKAMLEEV